MRRSCTPRHGMPFCRSLLRKRWSARKASIAAASSEVSVCGLGAVPGPIGIEERLSPDWRYQLNGPMLTLLKVRPFPDNGIENPLPPDHKLRRVPERPKVKGPKRNRKPIVVTGVQVRIKQQPNAATGVKDKVFALCLPTMRQFYGDDAILSRNEVSGDDFLFELEKACQTALSAQRKTTPNEHIASNSGGIATVFTQYH